MTTLFKFALVAAIGSGYVYGTVRQAALKPKGNKHAAHATHEEKKEDHHAPAAAAPAAASGEFNFEAWVKQMEAEAKAKKAAAH
eukprot:tig00000157_g9604.t1